MTAEGSTGPSVQREIKESPGKAVAGKNSRYLLLADKLSFQNIEQAHVVHSSVNLRLTEFPSHHHISLDNWFLASLTWRDETWRF